MNKEIIANASYYAFFALLTQALTLISQLLLMHHFSIRDYGYIGISFEAYIFLQMIIPNALRNFYLQKIRFSTDNNSQILDELMRFQLYYGSLIILLFGCIVSFLYQLNNSISLYVILSAIFSSLIQPLQAFWLANSQRFYVIAKDFLTSFVLMFVVCVCVFS
jgi:O-antigen/teichoic acid export membrane protein